MIKVKKKKNDAPSPSILIDIDGKGKRETDKAINFYKLKKNKGQVFKEYKVYKDKDVKNILNLLFHKKCAYCEMDYGGAPLDVEHFRPKGAIANIDPKTGKVTVSKPGYYWLASNWDNLLPSCIDCNRPREHEFCDGLSRVTGKANFFPLVKGSRRASTPTSNLRKERRLLINPCEDNPEKLLRFDEQGNVAPRFYSGHKYEMALASINYYGLLRVDLVRKRERHAKLLLNIIHHINQIILQISKRKAVRKNQLALKKEIDFLEREYLHNDAPFLALTRTLVKSHLTPIS